MSSWTQRNLPPQASARLANVKIIPSVAQLALATTRWCRPCLLKSHQSLPFHKIQFWNGKCFEDVTLSAQGFIWYMGHGGKSCPCYGVGQCHLDQDSSVIIVHSSGVFTHNVVVVSVSRITP
ncbi:hypothetical protein DEU56DRAFT_740573 [Suillus clintonianus]|uniref:uncharacterized protein n=1 Tax=Suillus clintonianus TaxID=1904413 RepID=UPI001B87F514|nr:uncharacterized protein DEU56DRAFT_740573 [Suillus clintonianus]KAG2130737.1 hypothetical protein DEU56DRAFT_740573 [Suillus clintonianus]